MGPSSNTTISSKILGPFQHLPSLHNLSFSLSHTHFFPSFQSNSVRSLHTALQAKSLVNKSPIFTNTEKLETLRKLIEIYSKNKLGRRNEEFPLAYNLQVQQTIPISSKFVDWLAACKRRHEYNLAFITVPPPAEQLLKHLEPPRTSLPEISATFPQPIHRY